MPKRLAAALCAVFMFAAVLAVVPFASPAAAHPLYGTVKKCAYDPFAGQQCWYETVRQWHYHPPASNAEEEAERKAKEEAERKKAEEERRRKNAAEAERKRREAAEAERKRKEAERYAAQEAERKRKEAEARAEAERQRREAERREADKAQREADERARQKRLEQGRKEYREKEQKRLAEIERRRKEEAEAERKAEEERQRKAKEKREQQLKEAQEEARKPKPCGSSSGEGATPHHKHGGEGTAGWRCHPDTPEHTHATGTTGTKCLLGYNYNSVTEKCELEGHTKFVQDGTKLFVEIEGQVVCTFTVGGAVTKIANGLLKGVSWTAKQIWGRSAELVVETPCDQAWDELEDWWFNYRPDTLDPKKPDTREGDGTDKTDPKPDSNDNQGDGSGSNQNQPNNQNQGNGPQPNDPQPRPTAEPPADDPIPESPTPEQYDSEFQRWNGAIRKHQRDEISDAERKAATDRWKQVRCNRGLPGDEHYC